jgi:transcription elongation factor Elf1
MVLQFSCSKCNSTTISRTLDLANDEQTVLREFALCLVCGHRALTSTQLAKDSVPAYIKEITEVKF